MRINIELFIPRIGKISPKILARKEKLYKRVKQYWHNPTRQTIPVFLVGSGRSGTNMIVYSLKKSWAVDLYSENHPAAFMNWRLRKFDVIESLIDRSYAPITLFKPTEDTHQADMLLTRFPAAKLIFAFRHYDDVVNSRLRKLERKGRKHKPSLVEVWVRADFPGFGNVTPPKETMEFIKSRWRPWLNLESEVALVWLFYNILFFDLNLDSYLDNRVRMVQYESIVANPQQEFKALCHFLRIPFDSRMGESVYSSSIKRDLAPPINLEIRNDCEELWQRLCHKAGVASEILGRVAN